METWSEIRQFPRSKRNLCIATICDFATLSVYMTHAKKMHFDIPKEYVSVRLQPPGLFRRRELAAASSKDGDKDSAASTGNVSLN